MRAFALIAAISLGSLIVHAEATVPFQATINTAPAQVGSCGGPCVVLTIPGTGTASHMGRVEMEGLTQINFQTLQQTGTSTLTAADGSSFDMSFVGAFVPGQVEGDATFQGTWRITTGTGRFEEASGVGTYRGSASGDTGVLFLNGTLKNPGNKP